MVDCTEWVSHCSPNIIHINRLVHFYVFDAHNQMSFWYYRDCKASLWCTQPRSINCFWRHRDCKASAIEVVLAVCIWTWFSTISSRVVNFGPAQQADLMNRGSLFDFCFWWFLEVFFVKCWVGLAHWPNLLGWATKTQHNGQLGWPSPTYFYVLAQWSDQVG